MTAEEKLERIETLVQKTREYTWRGSTVEKIMNEILSILEDKTEEIND